jgi:hypothetical protein
VAVVLSAAIGLCARIPPTESWDLSENRGNSFSEADDRALAQIHEPLRIEVHLAAEDPRRIDFERRALLKLRRVMPDLRVSYVSATATGLFEQANSGYGEIWYYFGSRSEISRGTTPEGMLETIYSLAGVAQPKDDDHPVFRGHPLVARTTGAAALFYAFWPGAILAGGLILRKRLR